jgi:YD repeat-containing protein
MNVVWHNKRKKLYNMAQVKSMESVTSERRNQEGVTSSMRVAWDQESSIAERTRTQRKVKSF